MEPPTDSHVDASPEEDASRTHSEHRSEVGDNIKKSSKGTIKGALKATGRWLGLRKSSSTQAPALSSTIQQAANASAMDQPTDSHEPAEQPLSERDNESGDNVKKLSKGTARGAIKAMGKFLRLRKSSKQDSDQSATIQHVASVEETPQHADADTTEPPQLTDDMDHQESPCPMDNIDLKETLKPKDETENPGHSKIAISDFVALEKITTSPILYPRSPTSFYFTLQTLDSFVKNKKTIIVALCMFVIAAGVLVALTYGVAACPLLASWLAPLAAGELLGITTATGFVAGLSALTLTGSACSYTKSFFAPKQVRENVKHDLSLGYGLGMSPTGTVDNN